MERVREVYIYKEVYQKELAHVVIEATGPKICLWQAGDPRESIVQFTSKSEGLRIKRANGIVHHESQQTQDLKTQEEPMFQFEDRYVDKQR